MRTLGASHFQAGYRSFKKVALAVMRGVCRCLDIQLTGAVFYTGHWHFPELDRCETWSKLRTLAMGRMKLHFQVYHLQMSDAVMVDFTSLSVMLHASKFMLLWSCRNYHVISGSEPSSTSNVDATLQGVRRAPLWFLHMHLCHMMLWQLPKIVGWCTAGRYGKHRNSALRCTWLIYLLAFVANTVCNITPSEAQATC